MTKLKEKSLELSKEILATKEYKEYEKANKNFKENKKSFKLFNDFQKTRNELTILENGGFDDKEKQREKFEKLLQEVKNNKEINDWITTQENLQKLISQTAIEISNKLKFPFTLPPKCGGGCSC